MKKTQSIKKCPITNDKECFSYLDLADLRVEFKLKKLKK